LSEDLADPVTRPPTRTAETSRERLDIGAAPARDTASGRSTRSDRETFSAAIVPAGSVTGRSLTLVISIMCFLACLTAGAVHLMNQSAQSWHRDIASEVTVQIRPKERRDTEKLIKEVETFLLGRPGVTSAKALSVEESAQLLEPWLGQTSELGALPVPRLISVETDRRRPPDIAVLKSEVETRFIGAQLDDHRHWQNQIRTVTRSFALGGLAILFLVAAATTAIIVSATRSAMASNREIVEVLHFVGATDRFIAREFSKHFLRLGVRAGLVGAVSAMLVFLLMPAFMELIGGGQANMADIRRLIGHGTLDTLGYLLLAIVVVVISALCMLTCWFGVYRILNHQQ
jgi:cell division transport system permease protein